MDLDSLFTPKPTFRKMKPPMLSPGEFYINVSFHPPQNVNDLLGTVYRHRIQPAERARMKYGKDRSEIEVGVVVLTYPSTRTAVIHVPKNKVAWVKHVILGQEVPECRGKSDTSTPTS